MPRLRVLSYNVRSMRDDRDALGRVIRSAEADVVLVQEAPRFAQWRARCAELARRGGLVVVGGGRRAGANLIMSTLSVDVIEQHDVFFSRDPRLHHRGTAIAVLAKQDRRFAVAGTHLDLVEAPRLRHVDELNQALHRHVPADVPVIIGGDFNDRPGSAVWTMLAERYTDALAAACAGSPFTSTATNPYQTIDGVFVDPRLTVLEACVLDQPDVLVASDHRPVLVEIDLDGAGD